MPDLMQLHMHRIFTGLTGLHTFPLKSKLNPDLAQQPSVLSPLSAVAPFDEPPVAASPPFLHHTLYLERRRSIQMIIGMHISEINEMYRRLSLSFLFFLTSSLGS